MASTEDVRKLAALARIEIPDNRLEAFAREFDDILGYISKLESLSLSTTSHELPRVRNVLREDGEPHAPGQYTEALASQFPKRDGDYLSVKQIISHD